MRKLFVAVLFTACFFAVGCGKADDLGGERAGASANEVGETPSGTEEADEPLNAYAVQRMEFLRTEGYPVYDENVIDCYAMTSPELGECMVLTTGDGKDKVVAFYVAAGGTPEDYKNDVVVFRDWEEAVGVDVALAEGEGTAVVYALDGSAYRIEEPVELTADEVALINSLRTRGLPVYNNDIIYVEYYGPAGPYEFYELRTRDDEDTVVRFFVDAGGKAEREGGYVIFKDWDLPIYISDIGPYAGFTAIYYGAPSA